MSHTFSRPETRNLVTQPPLQLQHRHMTQTPPSRFIHSLLERGSTGVREAMPIVHSAGKGGSGGVQLWVKSDNKIKFLVKRCDPVGN